MEDYEEFDLGAAEVTEAKKRAQGLYLAYHSNLSALTGDRPAIAQVRETMRSDPDFWEFCNEIYNLVEEKPDWISAIFRSESRRASRESSGRMEEIRREREEKRLAEIAAERSEMENLTNFGMF